jgi:hypothetical protein
MLIRDNLCILRIKRALFDYYEGSEEWHIRTLK